MRPRGNTSGVQNLFASNRSTELVKHRRFVNDGCALFRAAGDPLHTTLRQRSVHPAASAAFWQRYDLSIHSDMMRDSPVPFFVALTSVW
eukprot:CAMPEP_0180175668 /NCGR_PEP_ID=MMETSP0986-20121125/36844_1 /TAXON_ID=697907 /ORGANISM="non described non described, Strain CCMP2293" /LENGTH=88 /DNA_ID=CAMNT_0022128163 /DNA_START=88 /DNA_END=354 /DNA_ORIENTATION=+